MMATREGGKNRDDVGTSKGSDATTPAGIALSSKDFNKPNAAINLKDRIVNRTQVNPSGQAPEQ